ncbi:MAG: hypothetical protein ACPLSN_03605 [Dictyoglomus turgidum]
MFVGDTVVATVVKSLPNMDAYLVWIYDKDIFAQLPKDQALKPYRVGETLLACVSEIQGARVKLSQRSMQFNKIFLETSLKDDLAKLGWKILRAVVSPPIGKVLIHGVDHIETKELNEIFSSLKEKIQLYTDVKLYAIPYRADRVELIKEAFYPAPKTEIQGVKLFPYGQAIVYVSSACVPGFIGKNGVNVKLASKLCNMIIKIEAFKEGL